MPETIHICSACGYEYESEQTMALDFHALPEEWTCPTCGIDKLMFHHYACSEIVIELTGKLPPDLPFTTVGLNAFSKNP